MTGNAYRKVYLAGKIGRSDWRHSIFRYPGKAEAARGFIYNDPFFGTGEREALKRDAFERIGGSDFMFVWIDSPDAFGTLVEIGYAEALGIPIFIGFSTALRHPPDDMWLACLCAFRFGVYDTALEAWEAFVNGLSECNTQH